MSDEGWGGAADPTKRIDSFTKAAKALTTKVAKLHQEAMALVAANPVGELIKCRDVAPLAKLQVALGMLVETVDELHKPAYNGYEALRKQVLPPVMEDLEVENVKVAGVGRVELRPDMFVSTIKGGSTLLPPLDENDQPIVGPLDENGEPTREGWEPGDLHAWLARQGAADLITETVNASSLKALLRRKMKDGVEVPPELVKISPYTYAAIVKK